MMKNAPSQRHANQRDWLGLRTVWAVIVPAGLFVLLARTVVFPNDYWWHMRTGQIIWQEGHIPVVDRFSFTRSGTPWVNQAWLMQVAFYLLYRVGGLPWTILAHALAVTAGYTVLLYTVSRREGLRPAALATAVGAALGAYNWGLRPQSISFLLFGLLMMLIELHRSGRTRALWAVIPLFLIWVNAHGGFVFGMAVLGLYVLGYVYRFLRAGRPRAQWGRVRSAILVGLGTLVALAVNPQGPLGILRYVLGFLTSKVTVAGNQEFLPMSIREGDGLIFFLALLFFVLALLYSGYRPAPDQSASLFLLGGLSLWARRSSPWYGYVLIPPLAAALRHWWPLSSPIPRGKIWANATILALLAGALVTSLPWWRGKLPYPLAPRTLVSSTTPVEATALLCRIAPEGARVYQYQAFGAYQIWACPKLKVFIDTRIELYTVDIWRDYFKIEGGRFDWQEVADRYRLTYLFLSPKAQRDAVDAAQSSSCWAPLYGDAHALLFRRVCPFPSR